MHRDKLTLKLELEGEGIDTERLSQAVLDCSRDVCRLKMDSIEFQAKGTISEEHKIIVDERAWE